MHGIGTAVLLALANNVDNVGARVALGLKGIRISGMVNVWVAVITFAISWLAAWIGELLAGVIQPRVCSWVSMSILVLMGLWFLLEPVRKGKAAKGETGLLGIMENPEQADANDSKDIDYREAIILAAALSVNNIGGGLSAGMMGLNSLLMGGLSALFSFLSLWAGDWLAGLLRRLRVADRAAVFSGLLLIAIGVEQLFF